MKRGLRSGLVELLRARLSGFGPQPLQAIAATTGYLPESTVTHRPGGAGTRRLCDARPLHSRAGIAEEWCERHLLARIHRYTIKRLRREIEPVERQDFMRFLFDWQHLTTRHAAAGQ
jgi:ATP-dependent Lhr-like helicase